MSTQLAPAVSHKLQQFARRRFRLQIVRVICVLQTALSLVQAGRRVWVARDAVCSRQRANWEAGLALMERAGAVVAPVETLLFMWLGRSGTPEFKELSALIK